jgi:SAM-dependent methyltransferase
MTFDTSLVDLKSTTNATTSFSTIESDPRSDFGSSDKKTTTPQQNTGFQDQTQLASTPTVPSKPVQHLPTLAAYDQWASIYDTDGNMLQAIDDLELGTLLPNFLMQVTSRTSAADISILDLGCGTGRNTTKLLSYPWPQDRRVEVVGRDFSQGMLDVAAKKLQPLLQGNRNPTLRLSCGDCFPSTPVSSPYSFNAVISTLVLEHIPLSSFFTILTSLLQPNGLALVTNMHAEMGSRSQAGFVNAQGVKVRGTSFVYSVQETVQAAKTAGFEVINVQEREVQSNDVQVVGERGRKWIGVKVWYAVVLEKI